MTQVSPEWSAERRARSRSSSAKRAPTRGASERQARRRRDRAAERFLIAGVAPPHVELLMPHRGPVHPVGDARHADDDNGAPGAGKAHGVVEGAGGGDAVEGDVGAAQRGRRAQLGRVEIGPSCARDRRASICRCRARGQPETPGVLLLVAVFGRGDDAPARPAGSKAGDRSAPIVRSPGPARALVRRSRARPRAGSRSRARSEPRPRRRIRGTRCSCTAWATSARSSRRRCRGRAGLDSRARSPSMTCVQCPAFPSGTPRRAPRCRDLAMQRRLQGDAVPDATRLTWVAGSTTSPTTSCPKMNGDKTKGEK